MIEDDDFLAKIPFDAESDTISTQVWSFTKDRALEKALNRIDFRAKQLGRVYSILEDTTFESVNPHDPTENWQCTIRAQLL